MINEEKLLNALTQETYTHAEIVAIIKNVGKLESLDVISCEGVELNPVNKFVSVNGNAHYLPNKEFMLLYYMISNKNRIIKRQEMLDQIWGTNVVVGDRTIDVHIRKIRTIIGSHNLITRKCIGYGFFEKTTFEYLENNINFTL